MPVKIRGSFGALVRASNFASQYQAAVSAGDITEPESYSTTDLNSDLNVTGSAPKYVCRAWLVYRGTSTQTVFASGNISSITDNGTGDTLINFATALPSANYVAACFARNNDNNNWGTDGYQNANDTKWTTTQFQLRWRDDGAAGTDVPRASIMFLG